MIEEGFAPIPILTVPLLEQEVVGMAMLEIMAEALYGERDPTELFFHGQTQDIETEDGGYVLTLILPFVTKSDVSLTRNGDELFIHVGSYKRNIILPRTLASLPVREARFDDGKLRIKFDQKK